MTKKALLYIGGSHAQLAGIQCAQDAGLRVVSTDRAVNARAQKISDQFECIGAVDEEQLLQLALDLNNRYCLASAYGFSDIAYDVIGRIYEELELKYGNRYIYKTMADKSHVLDIMHSAGIPVPKGKIIDTSTVKYQDEIHPPVELNFPLVVKPAEVDSSQAVTTVDNLAEFSVAVERALKLGKKLVIEEFVDGTHYNVDMILVDGEAFPSSITERKFINNVQHQPLSGIQENYTNIENSEVMFQTLQNACEAIGFRNGPVTADMIISGNDVRVLEMSPHLHSVSLDRLTGQDRILRGWFRYTSGAEGWQVDVKYIPENPACAGYYYLYTDTAGSVTSIDGYDELLNKDYIADIDLRVKAGSEIKIKDGYKKLCAVINLSGYSKDELSEHMKNLPAQLVIKIT